jgi:hypothetical protein
MGGRCHVTVGGRYPLACGWSIATVGRGPARPTKSGSDDSYGVHLAQLVLSRFWVGADGAISMPRPLADRVPSHGGRVRVEFLVAVSGRGSLRSNQQAANLVPAMIIRYRIWWLRGDSPGASSHTIVGVHGKRRSEMRVHGVYEPPGLIDRRSGGIDVRKQLRRPILQGA